VLTVLHVYPVTDPIISSKTLAIVFKCAFPLLYTTKIMNFLPGTDLQLIILKCSTVARLRTKLGGE
jgi:hypothetical protein